MIENKEDIEEQLEDISWIMEIIDLEDTLDRLNVKWMKKSSGDEFYGFCPNHVKYTGKEPSHPKWYVNRKTGKTYCFTENRGSNLVYEASRILECSHKRALDFILGKDSDSFSLKAKRLKKIIERLYVKDEVNVIDLNNFKKQYKLSEFTPNCTKFLSKNLIKPKIAKDFGLVEFDTGYYQNRMICPYWDYNSDLVGFEAISLESSSEWLLRINTFNRIKGLEYTEKDFKKVLYPNGMNRGAVLYGSHWFNSKDIPILVEGSRDVLKLRQEGFKGSLGLGGSSITDDQLKALVKLTVSKKVIIFPDGDKAGCVGAKKTAEKCKRYFLDVIYIDTPSNCDPKDFMRYQILDFLKNKAYSI